MLQGLLLAFLITALIQVGFFALAAVFKTDKFTDLAYGSTFAILAIYFFSQSQMSPTQGVIFALVTIWGIRLSAYLFIRILKIKKDTRFNKIREDPLKFARFWALQAISIWIISLPFLVVLISEKNFELSLLPVIGIVLWLIGFSTESIADWQKFSFKSDPKNKDKWTNVGLWKLTRHPNYFGEITLWWGIFLIASPILLNPLILVIIGPISITFLLLFVTGIPPLEQRYNKKYGNDPNYKTYKKNTRLLIPLPK